LKTQGKRYKSRGYGNSGPVSELHRNAPKRKPFSLKTFPTLSNPFQPFPILSAGALGAAIVPACDRSPVAIVFHAIGGRFHAAISAPVQRIADFSLLPGRRGERPRGSTREP
jgi:hypothetical protein